MDKIDALTELKSLLDKGLLKYSEYDEIKAFVTNDGALEQDREKCIAKLAELVDSGNLTGEAYQALKQACVKRPGSFIPPKSETVGPAPAPSYNPKPVRDEKPLKGKLVGFCMGFFLGILGLILGICLGDEDCKKHSIIWFCVSLGLSIFGVIIYLIIAFAVFGTVAGGVAGQMYLLTLLSL